MTEIDSAVAVARALCARWEGFRAAPYLCPAGVPTIGYGFTRYADGTRVTLADPPMTPETAGVLLERLIRGKYLRETMILCPTIDTPERLGAITDFCYNLGAGALRSSTLRQKMLDNDWAAVPAELRRWVKGGGRRLAGLVARREAEIAFL